MSVFFCLDGGYSLDRHSVIYFILRIGPGVGVDQEPAVGVGTAPLLLLAPGGYYTFSSLVHFCH